MNVRRALLLLGLVLSSVALPQQQYIFPIVTAGQLPSMPKWGAQTIHVDRPGLASVAQNAISDYTLFVNASTVDNLIGSARGTFTCSVNPVMTVYECGTSTSCASPTAIGTVTLTGALAVMTGTVSNSAISAGHYIGWTWTAGTCTALSAAFNMQVHSN